MGEEDKQVFFAAAILLSASVGQSHEPVDEKQVSLAVDNARRLYAEVKRQHEEGSAAMSTDGVQKFEEGQARRMGQR